MATTQTAKWQYKPSADAAPKPSGAGQQPPQAGSVSWTASEYIEHERGAIWYLLLLAGTLILGALVYLITSDYISTAIVAILGLIVGVFAGRKPRQLTYELNESGLKIGEKLYLYDVFKSFSVVQEDGIPSITLLPLKRFMPPLSIYFAAQDEEQIASALSAHLPYQDQKPDGIDRLSRKLRL